MEKNLGKLDKVIRLVVGIVLILIAYFSASLGFLQWILYIVGLLLIIEVILGHCFLYKIFGINTLKKGKAPRMPSPAKRVIRKKAVKRKKKK